MGFLGKIANLAIATAVTIGFIKAIENTAERSEEIDRRTNTPCNFDGIVTKDQFKSIAFQAIKKIKNRKIHIDVNAPFVYGTTESQSGLSEWSFTIDFNDYGEITGRYWLTSENDDSIIPKRIADIIKEEINVLVQSNDEESDYNEDPDADEYHENNSSYKNPKKSSCNKLKNNTLRKIRLKALIFNHKNISIGYNYDALLHKNIDFVYSCLHNKAFNKIMLIPIYDIYVDSKYNDDEVEQIVIGGSSFFKESDFIPYDTEIIITYHKKKN